MKCLSLWQPWASGLVGGSKDNETRSWRPPAFLIGKTIGIHASKRWQREEREWAETLAYNGFRLGFEGTPPLGCIVGHARLVGCVPTESLYGPDWAGFADWDDPKEVEYQWGDYGPGRFAWLFDNHFQLDEPIPFVGSQGFFNIPDLSSLPGRSKR